MRGRSAAGPRQVHVCTQVLANAPVDVSDELRKAIGVGERASPAEAFLRRRFETAVLGPSQALPGSVLRPSSSAQSVNGSRRTVAC